MATITVTSLQSSKELCNVRSCNKSLTPLAIQAAIALDNRFTLRAQVISEALLPLIFLEEFILIFYESKLHRVEKFQYQHLRKVKKTKEEELLSAAHLR